MISRKYRSFIACLITGLLNYYLLPSVQAQIIQPVTPRENILKYKGAEDPPLWRLALGPVHISELYQIGKDTLFLGLKDNEINLPNREYILVDMVKGEPFWRYRIKAKTNYNLLSVSDNKIFLIAEAGEYQELIALSIKDGTSAWTYKPKYSSCRFYSVPGSDKILLDQRSEKNAEIAALDIKTGTVTWSLVYPLKKENIMPGIFTEGEVLIHFYEGVQRISIHDGQQLWSRTDLFSGEYDPPVQVLNDTLFISQDDNVSALSLASGKTLWSQKTEMFTTNLFPMENVIMIRGDLPQREVNGNYSFHIGGTWVLSQQVSANVTRYSDEFSGAFILIGYLENVTGPEMATDIITNTLKEISKGNPKQLPDQDLKDNPFLVSLKRYEGIVKNTKEKSPYQAILGTFWDPEQKKAAGILGYSSADLYSVAEKDILRAFNTFRFIRQKSSDDKLKANTGDRYCISMFEKCSGNAIWSFTTPKPTISNFLEKDNKVYFGTATELYVLDKSTGQQVFKKEVSDNDANYPVHLFDDGEKIYFIGELVIAAFNASSGEKIYSHGITPVSYNVSIAGLDNAIPMYTEVVKAISSSGAQSGFNFSEFHVAETRRYQNLANHYYSESVKARQKGDQVGYDLSNVQGRLAQYNAKMEANLAFASSVLELGQSIVRILIQKAILNRYQDMLSRQIMYRKSIIASYTIAEIGDYVYRPVRILSLFSGKDDFTALTIIHFPTGQRRTTVLSPTYLNYGLWNLVDLEKKVVYHHGIGLDPEYYEYSERINLGYEGRGQTINTFLIAAPLKIPK